MFSSGALLYQLIRLLLGQLPDMLLPPPLLALCSVPAAGALPLGALRKDNRPGGALPARRHAQFPVLVLAPDEAISPSDHGYPRA